MSKRTRHLFLAGMLLIWAALLGYYTWWLLRDELRAWQRVTVDFEDVGGLEAEDEVQANGTRIGRVASIELHGDKQRVMLEVEPELVIHRVGHEITVEPLNPLGFVAVRIIPGELDSPPIEPGQVLIGRLALGLGQTGAPGPARREALNKGVADMARLSGDMLDGESGFVGRLLADRERARALDEGLSQLQRTWAGVDRQLAAVEAGEGPGMLLASQDAALALGETAGWLHGLLDQAHDGLAQLEQSEGLGGRLLSDPQVGHGVREALRDQAHLWSAARRYEGLLGALHGPTLALKLQQLGARTREWTAQGVHGRGLLGALSHPEYDAVADSIHALPGSLERLERNPFFRGPEAREAVVDGLANVDDMLRNLRRGVDGLRAGLPDHTTFQGALFAVF